jgi:peptide/nickel transport system substrate-binding protein
MLPTSDINVRRALVHSFNYDLYIQKVMKGYAFRMTGMVPKGVPGNVADYPLWPYDLKKAKEFVDKASPEARQELAKGLKLPYRPDGVLQKEGVLMWQADLATIGIKLIPEEVDAATLSSLQTSAPGQPIVEARWYADFPDPDNFKNAAWTKYWPGPPTMGYGAAFAGDAKTDDLIDRGRSEIDPAKRRAIYRELELYFRDTASTIMLAQPSGALNEWNAQAASVKGFEYNPMIHPLFYNMYKEK